MLPNGELLVMLDSEAQYSRPQYSNSLCNSQHSFRCIVLLLNDTNSLCPVGTMLYGRNTGHSLPLPHHPPLHTTPASLPSPFTALEILFLLSLPNYKSRVLQCLQLAHCHPHPRAITRLERINIISSRSVRICS